jgi:hypothetical protein
VELMRCPSGDVAYVRRWRFVGISCECVPRNVNGLREYGFKVATVVGVVYGYFSVHRRGD